MRSRRDFCKVMLAGTAVGPALSLAGAAFAQTRANTLRVVWPYDTASLDAVGIGAQRSTWCISLHIYDRLVTYAATARADGTREYDPAKPAGELAERWEMSPDSKTITFHLRASAKFHDGAPVTAEDVRWSIERSLSVKGAAGVMAVGAL
jgi:peptide/nickel transport system substrate-binding protein